MYSSFLTNCFDVEFYADNVVIKIHLNSYEFSLLFEKEFTQKCNKLHYLLQSIMLIIA